MARPSIFDFAGGERAFLALATAHHERCLQDPELNHPFSHPGQPDHLQRLAAYWGEVFGGPARYTERWGGHSAMLEVHARTGAGEDFGPRFVACFVAAADDAGLPEDLELRDALRGYMEWAVREVLAYAPEDARVPESLPIRLWGWNGPE
jgi:hemoglobin